MKIGVDYYPEQWDRNMWERDAELMAKTGVKAVRIGEFAWSRIEPQDGRFEFDWLDEIVNIFARFAIEVIMCIPTSCPPMWLYKRYPETLKVSPDGNRVKAGVKSQRCINSPVFMKYAKRITQQLTRRYAQDPNIIAWQIDNELEAYPCCCDVCRGKFHNWLIDRFDNIQNINQVFGNVVWSGEYSDISQIEPPSDYPMSVQNPALCLEWLRFTSDSVVNYFKTLAHIVKTENKKVFVTSNVNFSENSPDFHLLCDEFDITSCVNYPFEEMSGEGAEYYSNAFYLDFVRGLREENFWVVQQLSGTAGGFVPMTRTPRPGMITGYGLQAIAHGADMVLFYRWRTATKGAEMFCHGLIDHNNIPARRFYEFSELCKIVSRLDILDKTEIVSDVAILYSAENDFALRIQPQTENFYYTEQMRLFHTAFCHYGANVDIVRPDTDLTQYKLVIAPVMFVNNKNYVENIYRYVINGGTAVITNRSGVKDGNNNCIMESLPTVYKELIGAEVVEYDPIGEGGQSIRDFAGNEFECREWCDILRLTTARAYAEYNNDFYRCCPAVTMNRYCGGVSYYVGTVCTQDFYDNFVSNLMRQTGIPRLKDLPEGVEVTTRTDGRDEFIFFFNSTPQQQEIYLPKPMYSVLSSIGRDRIRLDPYETEIVRK